MYGVVDGVILRNIAKDNEMNEKLFKRNVPSAALQPAFSIRPVSTKYGAMDIVDRRAAPTVPINKLPTYNINNTFNPGNAVAPWSGFATAIDVESSLRSQFFATQKCEQSEFVPSTKSDLYVESLQPTKASSSNASIKNVSYSSHTFPSSAGKSFFNNHTRQQRI